MRKLLLLFCMVLSAVTHCEYPYVYGYDKKSSCYQVVTNPLTRAVYEGDKKTAEALLNTGCFDALNKPDHIDFGFKAGVFVYHPLYAAFNNPDMLEFLLKRGFNPDFVVWRNGDSLANEGRGAALEWAITDGPSGTPLHNILFAYDSNVEEMQRRLAISTVLLRNGADVNTKEEYFAGSPLNVALNRAIKFFTKDNIVLQVCKPVAEDQMAVAHMKTIILLLSYGANIKKAPLWNEFLCVLESVRSNQNLSWQDSSEWKKVLTEFDNIIKCANPIRAAQ